MPPRILQTRSVHGQVAAQGQLHGVKVRLRAGNRVGERTLTGVQSEMRCRVSAVGVDGDETGAPSGSTC